MPEDYFGERVAARYDDSGPEISGPGAVDPIVDFLAALAGDGAALELGVGTGRIALPLAQREGGCFVIEVGVPDLQRLPPGETIRPFHVSSTRLGFDEYDVARQGLISHHYLIARGEPEVR